MAAPGSDGEGGGSRAGEGEPFSGIKEIVLDDAGRPMAIPRRPAPPPSTTVQGELNELVMNPLFLVGCAFVIGGLGLLIVIAQADAAASS